jgi:cold-inducible RNA-binding protein
MVARDVETEFFQEANRIRSRRLNSQLDFMPAPDLVVCHDWMVVLQQNHSGKEEEVNIYVGNLSFDTGNRELRQAFEQFGAVEDARIIEDRETGRSRGFGFVEMPNRNEAEEAINQLNGANLSGRTLTVNEARPRRERRY